uniref:Putative selenoprotein ixodes scapularis selenoprotein n=1 Tax=Amblyomma cajennense TaxID=34607 RepID=A0A023FRN6_AMBCJ
MVSIDSSFDRSANAYPGQSDTDPSFADTVLDFISTNGWFVTFGLIGLYVLYTKLGSYLPSWRSSTPQQQQNYGAAEADEFVKRQEAMERARRRMQEVQDALAEKQKEKMAQLEEQKRQEKIDNWEQFQQGRGLGSKLRNVGAEESSAESSKLSRRPKGSRDDGERLRGSDYNPLTGSSGGSSYRPERRCVNQGG